MDLLPDPESICPILNSVLHENIDQMDVKYLAQFSMSWVGEWTNTNLQERAPGALERLEGDVGPLCVR